MGVITAGNASTETLNRQLAELRNHLQQHDDRVRRIETRMAGFDPSDLVSRNELLDRAVNQALAWRVNAVRLLGAGVNLPSASGVVTAGIDLPAWTLGAGDQLQVLTSWTWASGASAVLSVKLGTVEVVHRPPGWCPRPLSIQDAITVDPSSVDIAALAQLVITGIGDDGLVLESWRVNLVPASLILQVTAP